MITKEGNIKRDILFNDEKKEVYPDKVNELFSDWERKVNVFFFDPKKEVDAIMPDPDDRCLYTLIALEWIHLHTTSPVSIDGGNAYAMKMIREVSLTPEYSKLYDLYFSEDLTSEYQAVSVIFCENARRMYRTLMQAMTAFMLCMLAATCEGLDERLEAEYGKEWWRLPLI